MMNGPYYRNQTRSVPVHKPKVVSIPVHFVSSDHHHHHEPQTITNKYSSSAAAAALKIQKVFKGHTVKKALNKIVPIKNQVDEIEKRLQNDVGFVRTLRGDSKERLRVNETLMSLLFKLDSVRGVENGVREVRKSVAKKAVALQERVDSIGQSFEEDDDDVRNGEDKELGEVRYEEDAVDDDVSNENCDQELVADEAMNADSMKEGDGEVINDEKTEARDVSNGIRNKVSADVVDDEAMNEDSMKEFDDDVSRDNVDSIDQTFETELRDVSKVNEEYVKDVVVDDLSNNPDSLDKKEDVKESLPKECDDDVSGSCCDQELAVNEDRMCGDDDYVSRSCCDKEMVEKLMCDNAKMMRLMIQISERNEMQTRMINSLSKRVEQLEKAFNMTDKSRRRKKSYSKREKDGFCI